MLINKDSDEVNCIIVILNKIIDAWGGEVFNYKFLFGSRKRTCC